MQQLKISIYYFHFHIPIEALALKTSKLKRKKNQPHFNNNIINRVLNLCSKFIWSVKVIMPLKWTNISKWCPFNFNLQGHSCKQHHEKHPGDVILPWLKLTRKLQSKTRLLIKCHGTQLLFLSDWRLESGQMFPLSRSPWVPLLFDVRPSTVI